MSLKHPFDVSYGLPEKSTANLMDYTDGTHLAKWQWDLIHDPGVVVRIFERDQDAQKQIFPDPVCVQKALERFRAAFVLQEKFTYPATVYPYAGHYANNLTLSDGKTYDYVFVNLYQDMDLIPFEFDREIKSSYWYGKVMNIDIKDKKAKEFHDYLFPTREAWDNQMNTLVSRIEREGDRTVLTELLTILPLSEYSRFSSSGRHRILKALLNSSLTEDRISCVNEEEIVLTLLKSIPLSDRKSFLDNFEPLILTLIKKLDGDNRDEILWLLSDYIQTVYSSHISEVTRSYFRSDGSVYNHVFYWKETLGPDPLYELSLNQTTNKILVSVRNDWWFSDSRYLMDLSAYDFIGLELNADMKYRLPAAYQGGDFLIMPALLFHWLCEQRNQDEAWSRFFEGVDLGFTLFTVGYYGAAKTALQVGTTYTIGMSLDYMIRLGINSLSEDDFIAAVEKTSLLDANWNAATMFISNSKMAIAINFSRNFLKKGFVDKKSLDKSLREGTTEALVILITNKLIPKSGKYANLIKNNLSKHPKAVLVKLRDYGVDKESVIELTKLLFSTSSIEVMNIIKEIDLIYE